MKFFNDIYFNKNIRIIYNYFYRNFISKKEEKIKSKDNIKSDVAIGLANLYFFEHIKDLFYKLKENNYRINIITPTLIPENLRKQEIFKYFQENSDLKIKEGIITYPFAKYINTKVYIECAISYYHTELKCKKFIYTHGMGGLNFGKDYELIKHINNYSGILLNGPLQKKALNIASKLYNVKLPEMYEIGYLRGDRLIKMRNSFNKEEILKKYGWEKDIPIILYMPTWGIFSSVKDWIEKIINICNKLNVYLIIKLHPLMLTEKSKYITNNFNNQDKLKKLINGNNLIKIIFDQNIDEIMLLSDILITDVSGISMEYMILEKPVIFLPAPEFFKIYGIDRTEKWCRIANEVNNEKELEEILKSNIINPKNKLFPINELTYNNGKVLEVFYNFVINNLK